MNHKDRSVTAVYDRYGMDREKMEALTRRLNMDAKYLGSEFDDFLREEGLLDEAEAVASKRVLAFQRPKRTSDEDH